MTDPDPLFDRHRAFFDFEFMRAQKGKGAPASDAALLSEVLDSHNAHPPAPNPLFDVTWAAKRIPGNPVRTYLERPETHGIWPSAMFCPAYFARCHPAAPGDLRPPVTRALDVLTRGPLQCHPMVDPVRLRAGLGAETDYAMWGQILMGEAGAVSPHLLVDLEYVAKGQTGPMTSVKAFFEAYHEAEEDFSTHPLFDVDHYRKAIGAQEPGLRAVFHYLATPAPVSPHPALDADYYQSRVWERLGTGATGPLEHYLTTGAAHGIDPSPYFRTASYTGCCGPNDMPLRHYLDGGWRHLPTHGIFGAHAFLSDGASDAGPEDSALYRLGRGDTPIEPGQASFFDAEFYAEQAAPEATDFDTALQHYLRHGIHAGVAPNPLVSEAYIRRHLGAEPDDGSGTFDPFAAYLDKGLRQRPRLLVGFDILDETLEVRSWLGLLNRLAEQAKWDVIVVALRHGPLTEAFEQVAHVWTVLGEHAPEDRAQLTASGVAHLARLLSDNPPKSAIVQTAEDATLFQRLRLHYPHSVAMLTGAVDRYDRDMLALLEGPDVTQISALPVTPIKSDVRDGMLCHPDLARAPQPRAALKQRLLQAMGLPEGTRIVLGAGPLVFDSGIDFFSNVAVRVLGHEEWADKAVFLWVGDGPHWSGTPSFYARHRVRVAGHLARFSLRNDATLARYLSVADAYVNFSDREDAAAAVIDACGAGVPVLSTGLPALTDLFEAAGGMTRAQAYDLSGVVEALGTLLRDDAAARDQADRAKALLRDSYDTENMLARLSAVPGLKMFKHVCAAQDTLGRTEDIGADRPAELHVLDAQNWTDTFEASLGPDDGAVLMSTDPHTATQGRKGRIFAAEYDPYACSDMVRARGRSRRWSRLVVHDLADLVTPVMLKPWPKRLWRLESGVTDLEAVSSLGDLFDRIDPEDPAVAQAMDESNPAVADLMRKAEEGAP